MNSPPAYGRASSKRGEVLVAIVNRARDFEILASELWYRVPVDSAPKRWPPEWMAFYLPKAFGKEAYAVRHFGKVSHIRKVKRTELFPDEPPNPKSDREYYQVFLRSLDPLPNPIPSLRLRRIVFIATTMRKLMTAAEINDLFDDSPLEDTIWEHLKRLKLPAERQWEELIGTYRFFLDFAMFCRLGKIDIEADGDSWHADTERIPEDNKRNNALASKGWHVLRFNGLQIRESTADYCVPKITETIDRLGGLETLGRKIIIHSQDGTIIQTSMFEDE